MLALILLLACAPCPEDSARAREAGPMAEALDTGEAQSETGDPGETGDTAPVDPCAAPYGAFELSVTSYAFPTAGTATLQLSGSGLVCAMSCDPGTGPAGWLNAWPSEYGNCAPVVGLPLEVDSAVGMCVEARDAGGEAEGNCVVETSAGDFTATLRWSG